jgi:hypothetical protein
VQTIRQVDTGRVFNGPSQPLGAPGRALLGTGEALGIANGPMAARSSSGPERPFAQLVEIVRLETALHRGVQELPLSGHGLAQARERGARHVAGTLHLIEDEKRHVQVSNRPERLRNLAHLPFEAAAA